MKKLIVILSSIPQGYGISWPLPGSGKLEILKKKINHPFEKELSD